MRALGRLAVGYDTSAAARDALALGELLARTTDGELLVVRVHPGSGEDDRRRTDELEEG